MQNGWLVGCVLVLSAACGLGRSADAQGCPSGMSPTGDGYCIAASQTYCGGGNMCADGMQCLPDARCAPANGCFPNEIAVGGGRCAYQGSVVCPCGGTVCPPGRQCSADGQQCLGAARGSGSCGGYPLMPGYACNNGRSYNPATQKFCGLEVCNILAECGQNSCLSPYHQQAAARQTIVRVPAPSQPTVRTPAAPSSPQVRAPGADTPTVTAPK